MPNNLERLAREYRTALENSDDGAATIEQIVILEENQLDYLVGMLPRSSCQQRRTLNYIKNVIYRSLAKLNALIQNTSYIPSFRNVNVPCQSLKSALPLPYSDIAEILSYENRKLGLISVL